MRLLAAATRPVRVAVVALGSYARRELCPGSDVDLLVLWAPNGRRTRRPDLRALAEHLWYPLWDAGFVLGHATRTVAETLALAERDLDALTALLDVRHVAGDPSLTADLAERGLALARRRRDRVLDALAAASAERRARPGPVAEMLEPNLKDGAGGLRDLHALDWAGTVLGPGGGLGALEALGYLAPADAVRLAAARPRLLGLRTALHRVTGGRSDLLALQEQDAVAGAVGAPNADEMVRDLAASAREVAWVAADVWSRVRDARRGPAGRVARADRPLAEGVVLRDGRVTLLGGTEPSPLTVLDAAAAAADLAAAIDRASLERLGAMPEPAWDVWERAAFFRLLRAGERAVPVFEALDHVGVLVRLLPEWERVRSRPQRNAYHRFTVDRHLLEAVAECARLLDAGDAGAPDLDAVVARACRRPELLLLAALLHDLGKGLPTDHSHAGSLLAAAIARRMRLDSEAVEVVTWLVRDHLLMADVATRRDLADAATVRRFAGVVVGDPERLRLLYLLTIGDSRATGPAAWGPAKAALVRDLFVKAAAVVESDTADTVADRRRDDLVARLGADAARAHLAVFPPSYALAFDADAMAEHHALLAAREPAVACTTGADGRVEVTVAAPDRTGLLATLAGALTLCGLSVEEAHLFSTADGMALDVFRAADTHGRFEAHGPDRVRSVLHDALAGTVDVAAGVEARVRNYRRPDRSPGPVDVEVDLEASDVATVVEVHADDEVGLLYRVAETFAALDLDVRLAKVATLGDRVVDVFYVRDAAGARITDAVTLDALVAALRGRLTAREPA